MMQKLTIIAIPILTSITYGDAIAHSGATGIVKERMDYFPAQSDIKPSEASPKIWSDFEGFTAAAQLNWKATVSLAKATKIGDRDSVITAFKETAESCKSCQKTYRLK